jgi:hypothetical protein
MFEALAEYSLKLKSATSGARPLRCAGSRRFCDRMQDLEHAGHTALEAVALHHCEAGEIGNPVIDFLSV